MDVLERYHKKNILNLPVYLINRKDHTQRLKNSLIELRKITNRVTIVQAVDSNYAQQHQYSFFSSVVYKNITRGPSNTSIIPTWAAGACAISHLKAWTMAFENEHNHEIVAICEDDIIIQSQEIAKYYILEAIHDLEKNPMTIWFFNSKIKYISKFFSNYAFYSSSIFGYEQTDTHNRLYLNSDYSLIHSHFYITTRKVLKQMINNFYPIEFQIDIHMTKILRDRCEISIVSSTENGIVQDKKKYFSSVQFFDLNSPVLLYLIFFHKLPINICKLIVDFLTIKLNC
jgi:GR25 family glycosyltransferase involved in LPS biosynthesis